MAKTIFEEMDVRYSRHGDYNLPNLMLPEQTNLINGKYGRMREKYIKEHRRLTYLNLLTSCTMNEHLAYIDAQAKELHEMVVPQMKQYEDITELLKSENQMEWVRRMNNIFVRAEEFVLNEIVYK